LSGLQRLSQQYGITIIVVHHTRKQAGEDPVDEISGTLGIAGAVDAFIVLKTTAKGKIMVSRGRDIEESELAVQFVRETCRWEILGDPETVNASKNRNAILTVLTNADGPMGPKDIAIATGIDENSVAQILYRLARADIVEKPNRGKYQLNRNPRAADGWQTGF
jgi:hypothetical protein